MTIPEMVIYRPAQLVQKKLLDRAAVGIIPEVSDFVINPDFRFPIYDRLTIKKLFSRYPYSSTYKIFDQVSVDLSRKVEWKKDYKNKILSDCSFAGNINRQNYNKNGDVKYVSELSRFHFLPFMALRASIANQPIIVDKITNKLRDWLNQNPYLESIHWTSGIEVGIRSINLIYCHLALSALNITIPKLDFVIKQHISLNYKYLRNHLSKYSSANNHRVAELVALSVISNYFSSRALKKERPKWNDLVIKELFRQTTSDGVNTERSFRYHAEVTDHFLNAFLFMERAGLNLQIECRKRLMQMLNFVRHICSQNEIIEFGDSDDGYLIYPYFDDTFSIYDSLLGSLFVQFPPGDTKLLTKDFRNYLMYGEELYSRPKTKKKKTEASDADKLFKEGGFCFMSDNRAGVNVIFDVGPIGDNITAAHGHSDLLHFTFKSEGRSFIIDPGTYQYHSNKKRWRDYFRGITAHNTISVNKKDHADKCTRMGWLNNTSSSVIEHYNGQSKSLCRAQHEAFKIFQVVHTRQLELDKKKKVLIINDELKSFNKAEKLAEFYLHFHPGVSIERESSRITLSRENTEIVLQNEYFNKAEIIKGDNSKPFGWYSPSYDKRLPSPSLVLSIKFRKKINIETEIFY